jgi:hypothetical protein
MQLKNKNSKTKRPFFAIVVSSLVSTTVIFTTPAMAQVSPGTVLQTGKLVRTIILKVMEGGLTSMGGWVADKLLPKPKPVPQVSLQYMRVPGGVVYRICKEIQNHNNYGSPYYCNDLGQQVSSVESSNFKY